MASVIAQPSLIAFNMLLLKSVVTLCRLIDLPHWLLVNRYSAIAADDGSKHQCYNNFKQFIALLHNSNISKSALLFQWLLSHCAQRNQRPAAC
jgi:hypothetical protein